MNAKVTILFTSDIHGHALPILYGTNEKAELGLVKYATAVKDARRKFENVLVIDNGDLIQGTPLMTHYVKKHQDKKNPMIELMNQIQVDAGVIGNHEFNFGKKILNHAIDQSNYPWLSANILDKDNGSPAFGPPFLIKTLDNGIKLALVGVTTHYIPNWESPKHIEGLDFKDAYQTLKTWVRYIRSQEKPDILIAAYHGGFERDIETGEPTEALTGENQAYQMCKEIEGVDVLLTGHQHRSLVGEVNDVFIVQPGNNAQGYGVVQIELEKKDVWQIINKKGKLQPLENVEADPDLLACMEEIELSTQRWLDEPVGQIKGDMQIQDPFQARIKKHPFIQFVHDVQKEASGVDISVTALFNNSTHGFQPVVTMRDIVSNYMYPNTLTVLELTGADIKAALEKSAEYFIIDERKQIIVNPTFTNPKPQHYNYDVWDGIEYTMNIANPVGSRIENITYHGEPIKATDLHSVVLNNYRASGGGNYSMLRNKSVLKEIQKDTVELIREYFEKHPIVEAYTIDNFTVYAK